MGLCVVSVLFVIMISSVVTTTSLQPREVAAPGSDITLSCSLSKNLNLNNLVVNWQRGESEVVHSYYHGRDQLERQSVVYKGRTHLFEDQLTVGNASLRLSDVQPSDQGPYTCDVTDEQGSTQEKLQLLVAAELRLRVLDQSFTKFLTLHPPPVCYVMPAEQRRRLLIYPLLLMLLGLVLLLSWKRSEQETKKDKKTEE
ncbi:V-set domain-containing T-cell activation inhibitor 1 isoform X2 [Oncorhynchus mykiss]|uniref:V-set domain-containing T-cell activation inhibitor 1 isoform X2 n=1 Tax=Oncorhynchus mykiss TaxID=8022 RepID=UPI0018788EE0|nr:V-set domain-containing T-cell activation inhibitor 1 isoform X2 [Oncorhynchus mykiss]